MRYWCYGFAGFLVLVSYAGVGRAQEKDKPFPTNDEINLLLTQGDRAMGQYKAAVDREERELDKTPEMADAVAKDREVWSGSNEMSKGMKTKPELFNSQFGVEIVLLLDDASRNALLCSNQASLKVPTTSKVSDAENFLHMAQTCQDTSPLLYTVSENAAVLYRKYLAAIEQLATESANVALKCRKILEKQK